MADDTRTTPTADAPPTSGDAPPREEKVYRGTGVSIGAVVATVVAVAAIIFIAQNTGSVDMEWLFFDFSWPLAAVMLAALAAGAVLAGVGGWIWRHRRRRALRQKEEIRRLKAEKG